MMAGNQHPEQDDVQGHSRSWSDETLKDGIQELERALAGLRELQSTQGEEDDDVQGHMRAWSDERLKQAVAKVQDALAGLRELPTTQADEDEVQGHARLSADKSLEQPISSLQRALATLRPGRWDADGRRGGRRDGQDPPAAGGDLGVAGGGP
jgi:DNA repair exonuclease SbcCD ATPase subunit